MLTVCGHVDLAAALEYVTHPYNTLASQSKGLLIPPVLKDICMVLEEITEKLSSGCPIFVPCPAVPAVLWPVIVYVCDWINLR